MLSGTFSVAVNRPEQQGTDTKTISTRLGHLSVAFTMDTYTHLLPGMQKSAMEKFVKAVNREARVSAV